MSGFDLFCEMLQSRLDAPSDECLEWPERVSNHGYGKFYFKGRDRSVHRMALAVADGIEMPSSDVFVLHSCHNRRCFNPAHLRWGTHTENQQERSAAGRHYRSKLSADDVRAIRGSDESGSILADRFGVSVSAISSVRRGSSYKWVD